MKKLSMIFLGMCLLLISVAGYGFSAQDDSKLVVLSKEILEAKPGASLFASFEGLKEIYFKEAKFNEFVDYLNSLSAKKEEVSTYANYYISLARYTQLKYLEENQLWDEYFAQGNNYRSQISNSVQAIFEKTKNSDPLNIYARLISWQMHMGQQDAFAQSSLADLVAAVSEYSSSAKDIKPIEDVAEKLYSSGEKSQALKLYKIYGQKLSASGIKDEELKAAALNFFKEGNLELAETLYDAYIERIIKGPNKQKAVPAMFEIARDFAYSEAAAKDAAYAESVFARIEALGGKDAFDESAMYLRAFNLEKAKDYEAAKNVYNDLLLFFPKTSRSEEALFKLGVVNIYILKDQKTGRGYFEKLTQREGEASPQMISALYQLGILSQWEEKNSIAKDYYSKLIEKAKGDFAQDVELARERLDEIDKAKPLEYNLKLFMDLSLKELDAQQARSNLTADPFRLKRGQSVNIAAGATTPDSGCMQPELQYLWSGSTGKTKPASAVSAFETSYSTPGTKVINVVIVSPSGIMGRDLDLIDVY